MISKYEIIGIFITVLLILTSVFIFVKLTEPQPIFRGYPSSEDLSLPVMTLE
jgi:hypothetical protein